MRLLTPIPVDRRPRRFVQLIVGLLLYGFTMGMMVRAVSAWTRGTCSTRV